MAVYKRGNSERKGKVTYNAGIVKGIVVLAVEDVQGVALNKEKLNLTKVTFNEDIVSIDITVDAIYGYSVPDVAFDIQQCVRHNIESMTKYKVDKVDVHFSSVTFEDNHA